MRLQRYIRGSGLAYGAHCSLDLEAGFVSFTLYRSSNSMEAFKQAANVIKGLTDGSVCAASLRVRLRTHPVLWCNRSPLTRRRWMLQKVASCLALRRAFRHQVGR